jgi:hypothetical protein
VSTSSFTITRRRTFPTGLTVSAHGSCPQTTSRGRAETRPRRFFSAEIAVLRRCVGWLTATLEREQWVVEDLRHITEVGEERVLLDRPKVLRILSRIAADLDELVGRPAPGSPGAAMDEVDSRHWLRKRMPRIDPPRGQRGAERKAANLARWGR